MARLGLPVLAFALLRASAGHSSVCAAGDLHGSVSLLQERAVRVPRSPSAEDVEAGWHDLDIVLEGDKWARIPAPVPGEARPYAPVHNLSDRSVLANVSIVVLVAALREPRTVHSLVNLFEAADHPERVFVGIVQQNTAEDEDVAEGLCRQLGTPLVRTAAYQGSGSHHRLPGEDTWGQHRFTPESLAACKPASRVRVYRMDRGEAAGPAYARSHQRRLLTKGDGMEDYCLQIDAHAVFAKGWDSQLLQQFAQTENEYAVLSTYPTNADDLRKDGTFVNTNDHWEVPHLCEASVLSSGIARNGQASAAANLRKPVLSKLWAAGLSFSRCHAERDVPADPHLKQIFDGEEFSRGARLWTSGYDFYSLSRPVVGVYYGAEKGNKGTWHRVSSEQAASNDRLDALLGHGSADPRPESLRGFDLGTRRRYEDYVEMTGVDLIHMRTKPQRCLIRKWTPWAAGAQPPYQALHGAPPPL